MLEAGARRPLSGLGVSALMIGGAIACFLFIARLGSELTAPSPAEAPFARAAVPSEPGLLPSVLLAWVVVILAARALGTLFGRLRQPPVIGEVIAGILLGPSLFGRLAPQTFANVFATGAVPVLGMLSQLGIVLFMFFVGMELDTASVRRQTGSALIISVASMTVAFASGSAVSLYLYPRLATSDVPFGLFALFLGVALSVTAFPVLVRILTDRGMQGSELGSLAISCAAFDDVSAWCLLAFVSSARQGRFEGAWLTFALTAGYVAFVFVIARPLIRRLVRRHETEALASQSLLALMVVAMLLSALVTEQIGIHAVFGAFLAGTVMPHDSSFAREAARKLQDFVVVLFLPVFFAFTGLRTQVGLLHGAGAWLLCLLITLVACMGKFGGTLAASRFCGFGWRQSTALGVLMNTRGLMELIVLNVGLEQGVISPTLFTMLVVMAVVTTVATTPVLDSLQPVVSAASATAPTAERS